MTDLFNRVKEAFADWYRVESEIGRGGMATVYLAEDLKHHRKVAVKVLQPEIAVALGQDRSTCSSKCRFKVANWSLYS